MNEKMFYDVLVSMAKSLKSIETSLRYMSKNASRETEHRLSESRRNRRENSRMLTEHKN